MMGDIRDSFKSYPLPSLHYCSLFGANKTGLNLYKIVKQSNMLSPAECLNPEAIESAKSYVYTLLRRNSITQTTLPFSSSYSTSKSLDTDAQLSNCLIEILLRMEEGERRAGEVGERWEGLNEELKEAIAKLVNQFPL